MLSSSQFDELVTAVEQVGFAIRGGFCPRPEDQLPADIASVVVVGNIGQRGFAAFRASSEWGSVADPMERYTERVLGEIAERFDAQVVYPHHGPPYWPFQRWAMRAEPVSVSPVQILIHPVHGLWHAYRAALLFAVSIDGLPDGLSEVVEPVNSPCVDCRARPCLSACPVDAFTENGFDRARCVEHLSTAAGRACLQQGCIARNACPVAADTRYSQEQREFHMRAFLASLQSAGLSAK